MARASKLRGIIMTADEEIEKLRAMVAMLNDVSGCQSDWDGTKRYGQSDVVKVRRLVSAWVAMLDDADRSSTDIHKDEIDAQRSLRSGTIY